MSPSPAHVLSFSYHPGWDRFGLVAMTVVGVIVGLAQVLGAAPLPGDAAVYWTVAPGRYEVGVYGYPPLLIQLLQPLRATNLWWLYVILWTTLCCASLGYVLGRWAPLALALAFWPAPRGTIADLWVGPSAAVMIGNVTMPMVAAMVAGMRRPGWWAVPLLTKMTAGVGVLWFAFRGEWRRLAVGIGLAGAIAAASFLVAPGWWVAFAQFAAANLGANQNGPEIVGPPLAVRLLAGVALVAIAARLDQPRLVPIACAVSVVGLYGLGTFGSIAVAALSPRLDRRLVLPRAASLASSHATAGAQPA